MFVQSPVQTVDFEMALRVADEFNFRINSFHRECVVGRVVEHVLFFEDAHEAYEIASRFAERNITVALSADNYAYKMEALEGRLDAPSILTRGAHAHTM
jgi:hypothetical protein